MLFGMRGIGHELTLTSINVEGDVCIVFFFYRLTRVRISIHKLTYMDIQKTEESIGIGTRFEQKSSKQVDKTTSLFNGYSTFFNAFQRA